MEQKKTARDTTDLLVYGHEGWLEDYPSHYHAGDPIMAKLKWGHNMEEDGLPRIKELTYHAYAPDGTCAEAKAEEAGDFWFDLTADTDQEGFYTMAAKYDNCYARYGADRYKRGSRVENPDADEVLSYVQCATTCISVGHHHETDVPAIPGLPISLLPTTGPKYTVHHPITFQLTVEDKPVSGNEAVLIYQSENGPEETPVTSDENGQFHITPAKAGMYCLIARVRRSEKKEGEYDGQSLTASHCFRVMEESHSHGHEH